MSTNVNVLPLLPSVMSILHVRTVVGLLAADAMLVILETEKLPEVGLWSVESRDSSVVSSQKGVTLLCEFCLLGDKVFLLRSNSTGNLIQKAKNQLQYVEGLLASMLSTLSILAIAVNFALGKMLSTEKTPILRC